MDLKLRVREDRDDASEVLLTLAYHALGDREGSAEVIAECEGRRFGLGIPPGYAYSEILHAIRSAVGQAPGGGGNG